jgi:hypothetical protein
MIKILDERIERTDQIGERFEDRPRAKLGLRKDEFERLKGKTDEIGLGGQNAREQGEKGTVRIGVLKRECLEVLAETLEGNEIPGLEGCVGLGGRGGRPTRLVGVRVKAGAGSAPLQKPFKERHRACDPKILRWSNSSQLSGRMEI